MPPGRMSKRSAKSKTRAQTAPPPGGWKRWRLRLVALVGAPLLFFGLLELGLRLGGFGYPTSFFLPSSSHGQSTWVQNNQFGWRFFGPRMARVPRPSSILRAKPPGTVRIFVLGESAAFGDPQPRFGLPRVLEAMLELRHPGVKFEVINAAMTGINSHVLVPLARDCARAGGDVWVIYMGNNEVVGPFGAGGIFGTQVAPLPLIRASLAFKSTRTGQLLDSLRQAAQRTPASKSEWAGMRMFLDQKAAAADPRMEAVYRNFQRNLADMIRAGRDSSAGVVVSTVAVNLKDCAPFASLHRADLSSAQETEWDAAFESGVEAQQARDWRKAEESFRSAARIDDRFAGLRFRLGQCARALGELEEARSQFAAARDLDALRFRCDSRLNDLIRQAGAKGEASGILLADAERALAATSPEGLPGAESFYEHVHLTFEGNYLLARAIAEQVEKLLPRTVPASSRPWPEMADCARRLARTGRAWQLALSDILGRLTDAPFTLQSNHADQQRRLIGLARRLPLADSPASLREAQETCEAAIAGWPDDALLYEQLAELKQAETDSAGAVAAANRSLDLLPSNQDCWLLLGLALAQQEKFTDAASAFRHVFELDPQAVWGRHNLALCLDKLGRRDQAISQYRRALAIKPSFGTAWLGLSQLYEEMGRKDEAAECFRSALANRINTSDYLATLARACLSRRYFEAAVTNFAEAVELSPSDPGLLLEAGRSLAVMGRHAEAAQRYAEAIQIGPGQAQPHLQLGIELGRLARPAEAEREFREALRLMPDSLEARRNLGVALSKQDKVAEALKQFEEVLQRDPADSIALKYAQELRSKTSHP
jgi:tetratricopeptide (TPR) repeat protein